MKKFEIAVQINGKTKGTLAIGRNDAKDDVIAKAKESIADKTGNIVKEITFRKNCQYCNEIR